MGLALSLVNNSFFLQYAIMPKAEKGSLKDLGKRIKAKGLQKLRFWCEMCQKQCRDANGFKCHMQSESHLRQMKVFSESAGSIVNQKSREFEKHFLDTLRLRHSTTSVNANNVYQEVIRDKTHVHMNATMWATLSDFVQYLGKHGKCVVQETERGWFIQYIDRDVTKMARQQALEDRRAADAAAEAAYAARIEHQRLQAVGVGGPQQEATKLERGDATSAVRVKLTSGRQQSATTKTPGKRASVFGSDDEELEDNGEDQPPMPPLPPPIVPTESSTSTKRSRSAAKEEKRDGGEKKKQRNNRMRQSEPFKNELQDCWLYRDIVARIVNRRHRLYKTKVVIDKVEQNDNIILAHVRLQDDDDSASFIVPQNDLETVVPKRSDERVRILSGKYRGKRATVVDLNKPNSTATLELSNGTRLKRVDFDDFSLLA